MFPYARIGQPSVSGGGFLESFQKMYADLPSSVFEVERPGCNFSVKQRIATYFFKGVLYGAVGFGCGLIGQGIANMIMTAKRMQGTPCNFAGEKLGRWGCNPQNARTQDLLSLIQLHCQASQREVPDNCSTSCVNQWKKILLNLILRRSY